MVKIINGNILDCKENIIVHQVNVQGYMGGGLALQLANKYKGLEEYYSDYCKKLFNYYEMLSGTVFYYKEYEKIIANIFSQKENFDTDYMAMRKCLINIKEFARYSNLNIAIPYKIGCGIAHGDWNMVYKVIEEVFDDYDVTIYRLVVE